MTYATNVELDFVYEYDFAIDGGAISTIPLRAIGNAMENGLTIEQINVHCTTAIAGVGAVVTVGHTGSLLGYFDDIHAISTTGASFETGAVAGSLLWDAVNKVNLNFVIDSVAHAVPQLTISVGAVTAGKVTFIFKCRKY